MAESNFPEINDTGKGYVELHFRDFKHFLDYVYNDMLEFESYIWRGHRCDTWALEPTLDRLVRTSSNAAITSNWDFASDHLECFKYAIRGRRGANPPVINDENDWWALGQHHGLATPLLDWSHSPFVATFFAFQEPDGSDQTSHRAIYALHRPSVESAAKIQAKAKDAARKQEYEKRKAAGKLGIFDNIMSDYKSRPEIEFVRPLSDENSRLVSQRGLFTRNYANMTMEEWVQAHQEGNGWTLMKFLVPNTERTKCLQFLNRMNINPLSLFPDLSGASQYCNLAGQIDGY